MKRYLLNKTKYLGIFFLTMAIYWAPDIIVERATDLFKYTRSFKEMVSTMNLSYQIAMGIAMIIGVLLFYKLGFYEGSFKTFQIKNLFILFLLFCLANILMFFGSYLYSQYFTSPIGNASSQINLTAELTPVNSFIRTSIMAPIFEEAAFRACIYRFFQNEKIAFLFSICLFAWMHTGFTISFFIYLMTGVVLTFAFHRRKILLDSMLIHGFYNAFLTSIMILLQGWTGLYF